MKENNAKALIKRMLGVGTGRIKIADNAKIKEAITADDLRNLIKEKAIKILPTHGVSRARGRENTRKRAAGRRRGRGNKKGTRNARDNTKENWIIRVRRQRALLKNLKLSGNIESTSYWKLYRMVKGNHFKNKSSLILYINEHGLAKEKIEKLKKQS